MIASLRQWFYPKEFRIQGIGIPASKEVIKRLEDLMKEVLRPQQVLAPELERKFVAEIATTVWRWKNRMNRMEVLDKNIFNNKYVERVKKVLSTAEDVLRRNEITIRDDEGKEYDPRSGWKVVGSCLVDGIKKPIIHETVLPCVLHHGIIFQRGEIIVGTPKEEVRDEVNNRLWH